MFDTTAPHFETDDARRETSSAAKAQMLAEPWPAMDFKGRRAPVAIIRAQGTLANVATKVPVPNRAIKAKLGAVTDVGAAQRSANVWRAKPAKHTKWRKEPKWAT
jgi:hypothetical protein